MAEDRTITIDDVARLAGVSRATVGRVVGNYGSVSEKSKERVWEAVKQLDYQPNLIARGLRSQSTKTIAVVIGSIRNTYSTALVYAVEKEAQKKGYNVLICTTHEDIEKEIKHGLRWELSFRCSALTEQILRERSGISVTKERCSMMQLRNLLS